jgi:FkbM family methyltransferase
MQIHPILQLHKKYNKSFIVNPNDALGKEIIFNATYEQHFLDFINIVIKDTDICIDCGTNLGFHTVFLSSYAYNGKIFSFEPIKTIFHQCITNCYINECYNVDVLNYAVSDEVTNIKFQKVYINNETTNIGAYSIGNGEDFVKTIKIDDLELKKVDFIKLDVQGCELKCLLGASRTIQTNFPILCIELENPYLLKFDTSAEYIMNYLLSLGYILLQPKIDYPADHFAIHRSKMHNYTFDGKYNIIDANRVSLTYSSKYNGCVYSHIQKF